MRFWGSDLPFPSLTLLTANSLSFVVGISIIREDLTRIGVTRRRCDVESTIGLCLLTLPIMNRRNIDGVLLVIGTKRVVDLAYYAAT